MVKKLAEKNFNGENLTSTLANSGVRIMTRTTAFGLYDNCVVGLLERVNDHVFFKQRSFSKATILDHQS